MQASRTPSAGPTSDEGAQLWNQVHPQQDLLREALLFNGSESRRRRWATTTLGHDRGRTEESVMSIPSFPLTSCFVLHLVFSHLLPFSHTGNCVQGRSQAHPTPTRSPKGSQGQSKEDRSTRGHPSLSIREQKAKRKAVKKPHKKRDRF